KLGQPHLLRKIKLVRMRHPHLAPIHVQYFNSIVCVGFCHRRFITSSSLHLPLDAARAAHKEAAPTGLNTATLPGLHEIPPSHGLRRPVESMPRRGTARAEEYGTAKEWGEKEAAQE